MWFCLTRGCFVVEGIQKGGCCLRYDTVYCCEECVAKSMTQNSKHNCFLLVPAGQCRFLQRHCRIPMVASVVQELTVCVCVCFFWAGVAQSLFIPGFQLTHEVMVVTLTTGSAAFIPFVPLRLFTHSSGTLFRMVCGHVLEPSPRH